MSKFTSTSNEEDASKPKKEDPHFEDHFNDPFEILVSPTTTSSTAKESPGNKIVILNENNHLMRFSLSQLI